MIKKISVFTFLFCGAALATGQGLSSLQMAVLLDQDERAHALIQEGADLHSPSSSENLDGSSALHLAAAKGNISVLLAMLRKKPDLETRDLKGRTPLISAACQGKDKSVQVLIDANARLNFQDLEGHTALHCAARRGHLETARLLIKADALLDIKDEQGYTPMLRAVRYYLKLDEEQGDAFFGPLFIRDAQTEERLRDGLYIALDLWDAGADESIQDKFQNSVNHYINLAEASKLFASMDTHSEDRP